jgi:3-hydroxyisobutyrate dehydrogenase-like beta-hydroxyacid dehydrogenase
MLEVRGPKMTAGDFADASFPLAGLQKDIDTIAAFAHDLHVPLPLFATAGPIYQAGLAQHRESMDPAVVFAVLEQLSRPCAGPTAQQ